MRPDISLRKLPQGTQVRLFSLSVSISLCGFQRVIDPTLVQANVTCTPSTPAPARKRRRPNQDLQERLARCEELLKEYATAKPDSPPPAKPPSPKPADRVPELEDPLPKWKPAGKLIEEDGGVRFMDSYLLTTVYDEVHMDIPAAGECGVQVFMLTDSSPSSNRCAKLSTTRLHATNPLLCLQKRQLIRLTRTLNSSSARPNLP